MGEFLEAQNSVRHIHAAALSEVTERLLAAELWVSGIADVLRTATGRARRDQGRDARATCAISSSAPSRRFAVRGVCGARASDERNASSSDRIAVSAQTVSSVRVISLSTPLAFKPKTALTTAYPHWPTHCTCRPHLNPC